MTVLMIPNNASVSGVIRIVSDTIVLSAQETEELPDDILDGEVVELASPRDEVDGVIGHWIFLSVAGNDSWNYCEVTATAFASTGDMAARQPGPLSPGAHRSIDIVPS